MAFDFPHRNNNSFIYDMAGERATVPTDPEVEDIDAEQDTVRIAVRNVIDDVINETNNETRGGADA